MSVDTYDGAELWGPLFFSNDPVFVGKILAVNKSFVTLHFKNRNVVMSGVLNDYTPNGCVSAKNGYADRTDYTKFPITITCGVYKDNVLVGPQIHYTQLYNINSSVFMNAATREPIFLETPDQKIKFFITPESRAFRI